MTHLRSNILVAILALSLVGSAIPGMVHAASTNLVQNPSFESGTAPWTTRGPCISWQVSTLWAFASQNSALVDVPCTNADDTKMLYQEILVTGGVSYKLSARFNVQGLGLDGPALAIIWYNAANAELDRDTTPALGLGGSSTELTVSATAPATATKAHVGVIMARWTPSKTFVDDFRFIVVPTLTKPGVPLDFVAIPMPAYVHLDWKAPDHTSGGPPDAYVVERQTQGQWHTLVAIPAVQGLDLTFYRDYTADPFTIYAYRVYAVNEHGLGPTSPPDDAQSQEMFPTEELPVKNPNFANDLVDWQRIDSAPTSNANCFLASTLAWDNAPALEVRNGTSSPCGVYQNVTRPAAIAPTYTLSIRVNAVEWRALDVGALDLGFYTSGGVLLAHVPIYPPASGIWDLSVSAEEPPTTAYLQITSQDTGLQTGGIYFARNVKLLADGA